MSFQEKRTTVSILSGIAVMAAYLIYAFGRYNAGSIGQNDLKFWATTMLVFIGIGIVATIIIQIVFHILYSISLAVKEQITRGSVNEKEIGNSIQQSMVEDEMDRIIDLKSNQVGFVVAGVGFVAGLISLVMQQPAMVMLNILFISFNLGSILEGVMQLYYYRTGVAHA